MYKYIQCQRGRCISNKNKLRVLDLEVEYKPGGLVRAWRTDGPIAVRRTLALALDSELLTSVVWNSR